VFCSDEEICLSNKKVKEWASNAISEIAHLYSRAEMKLSFVASNRNEVSLLPIPHSNDGDNFAVNMRRAKWVE